jgi:hypothetical protein
MADNEGDRPERLYKGKTHFHMSSIEGPVPFGGGVEPSREDRRPKCEPWRVGRHYGIHVYEGDRPVATFLDAADAQRAVAAEARIVELTAALRRYGEHDDECPRWRNQAQECTCGLDAALAAAGEGEDRPSHTQECEDFAFQHHAATGGDADCICHVGNDGSTTTRRSNA